MEAAVRRGFNVLTGGFGVPIERMAEFRRLFDRMVAEVCPPHPPEVGVQRAVYVTHSPADARAAAEEARWNRWVKRQRSARRMSQMAHAHRGNRTGILDRGSPF